VTKRKKYVDDLDIQLSDENRSADEDSVVVDANDYINGIPMDQPTRDIFVVNFSLSLFVTVHVGALNNIFSAVKMHESLMYSYLTLSYYSWQVCVTT